MCCAPVPYLRPAVWEKTIFPSFSLFLTSCGYWERKQLLFDSATMISVKTFHIDRMQDEKNTIKQHQYLLQPALTWTRVNSPTERRFDIDFWLFLSGVLSWDHCLLLIHKKSTLFDGMVKSGHIYNYIGTFFCYRQFKLSQKNQNSLRHLTPSFCFSN